MNGKKVFKLTMGFALSQFIAFNGLAALQKHKVLEEENLDSITIKYFGTKFCSSHIKAFNKSYFASHSKLKAGIDLIIPEKSSCIPNLNKKGELVSLTRRIYTVQLASYASMQRANERLKDLQKIGVHGVIRKASINTREWFRVQVGEYMGYSSARFKLDSLKEKELSGIIMSTILTSEIEARVSKKVIEKFEEEPSKMLTVINDIQKVGVNTITDLKAGAKKRFEKLKNQ